MLVVSQGGETMRTRTVLVVAGAVLASSVGGMALGVDLTGTWVVDLGGSPRCIEFVQTGTDLTAAFPCGSAPSYSGTITDFSFAITQPHTACTMLDSGWCDISGVVSLDGNTFTGGQTCHFFKATPPAICVAFPTAMDGVRSGLTGDCPSAPRAGCAAPGKSLLLITDRNGDGPSPGDTLSWKWRKGPAIPQSDFGDPTLDTSYSLCLYAGTSAALTAEVHVAAQGSCGAKPCWKAFGTSGYDFHDPSTAQDGALTIRLRGSAQAGKSKLIAKGKDAHLAVPPLPLAPAPDLPDVTVQLVRRGAPTCWATVYPAASIRVNSPQEYKAVR